MLIDHIFAVCLGSLLGAWGNVALIALFGQQVRDTTWSFTVGVTLVCLLVTVAVALT